LRVNQSNCIIRSGGLSTNNFDEVHPRMNLHLTIVSEKRSKNKSQNNDGR
jgi:hypothetical protein